MKGDGFFDHRLGPPIVPLFSRGSDVNNRCVDSRWAGLDLPEPHGVEVLPFGARTHVNPESTPNARAVDLLFLKATTVIDTRLPERSHYAASVTSPPW